MDDPKVEMRADAIDAVRDRFRVKIQGICGRCSHAHIWRTPRMNEPVVKCNSLGERVPSDVSECSEFKQLGVLSVWELAQLCLDIDISKPTKRVGFGKDE